METVLIIVVLLICFIVIKSKQGQTNKTLEEIKEELKRLQTQEKVSPAPIPVPDLVDQQKEPEELPSIPPPVPVVPIIPEPPVVPEPSSLPPPPPSAPKVEEPVYRQKEKKPFNYEKYIGENLFGKIGILILVAGVGFFVKYAIDKDWINEVMRTALGFAFGIVLLLLSARLKTKYRTFSSLLAGGAFAIFYVTVAIAYHYYGLFSQPVAFAILILVTILMSLLAVLYDRRELAIIALVGGFIAPFLVSSGEGNYKVLFTYILILNLGMFFLSSFKKWSELPIICFLFTTGIMGIFVSNYFGSTYAVQEAPSGAPVHLLLFSVAFYFTFLLPLFILLKNEVNKLNQILLCLVSVNNFVFLAFALYFIDYIDLSFEIKGLVALFIALVNTILMLWVKKGNQENRLLTQTLLGMVVVFITLAVPLQLDGNMITLLWAAEMLVLAWLYLRSNARFYECGALVLLILTLLSFLADTVEYANVSDPSYTFLITHLFTGTALVAFAWAISRYRETFDKGAIFTYRPWNTLLTIFAILVFYYVFGREISAHVTGTSRWFKAEILFTVSYLLLLVVLLRKRYPISKGAILCHVVLFMNLLLFAIDSYVLKIGERIEFGTSGATEGVLSWAIAFVTLLTFIEVGRQYYSSGKAVAAQSVFTGYFTVLATLCWLSLENLFINHTGLYEESSAAFSIALSIAGFVQMALGMRLHRKVLRKLSLITIAVVLAKLILIDIWAMPTIGKIIVFIFLGATLLILSFLYQKLKSVLFGEDEEVI